MKKFLRLFAMTVLSLCVLTSCACTFIDNSVTNIDNPPVISGDEGNSSYSNLENTVVNGADVSINYRNVIFNLSTVDYSKVDVSDTDKAEKEAYEKVKRSSVAILTQHGAGSGVIVDMNVLNDTFNVIDSEDTLYVLTCHHMVDGKGDIEIYIADEDFRYTNDDFVFTGTIGGKISDNSAKAVTLIGGDLNSDIALLKLDLSKKAKSGNTLSTAQKNAIKSYKARIPNADYKTTVLESVFSIGNPTGELPGTASSGKTSYLEREVSVDEIGSMLLGQMDVTSNPGNSGGGLYNLYGDLIGITNAGNTEYQNINFYIPYLMSNDQETTKYSATFNHGFKYVAEMLLSTASGTNYGCVPGSKLKLGFTVVQDTDDMQNSVVYVQAVNPNSIAEKSGLKVNDIIQKIAVDDGEYTSVSTVSQSSSIISSINVGQSLKLKVKRYVNTYNRWGVITSSQETTVDITMKAQQYWFCFND